MTERQHAIDHTLAELERSAGLACGALAQRPQLTDLDVHILMLSAQANRLAYKTAAGEWAITERGRRTLHQPDRVTSRKPPPGMR
jgi:hypothetical protein